MTREAILALSVDKLESKYNQLLDAVNSSEEELLKGIPTKYIENSTMVTSLFSNAIYMGKKIGMTDEHVRAVFNTLLEEVNK